MGFFERALSVLHPQLYTSNIRPYAYLFPFLLDAFFVYFFKILFRNLISICFDEKNNVYKFFKFVQKTALTLLSTNFKSIFCVFSYKAFKRVRSILYELCKMAKNKMAISPPTHNPRT